MDQDSPNGHVLKSMRDCSSLDDIRSTLADLELREAAVTCRLDALIASQNDLSRDLGRLDLLRAHLGSQVVATRSVSHGLLSDAAATAKRISSAVKALDTEQENVKATLAMVEQVAELKACVLGVHGSMGAPQDWETAAAYLSRASKIPPEVIDGSFAEDMVPTAEVPDPPRVTLDNAAESLCGLFLREFEKATKDADGARVTRFFKLFPLIGRTDVGLDAYGRYVCQGVAARARQSFNATTAPNSRRDGFFYANALTRLFEHIAQIVDGHEPVVERHYGSGMMTRVIERLQNEADVQGGIILDSWYEERNVERRLTDIKSHAYSFLVQSYLPVQKAGILRSDSPAKRDGTPRQSEDDGVDIKEIDALLGESALMLGRWSLYSRFLASKSTTTATSEKANGTSMHLTMPVYLTTSNLYKKISSHLLAPFTAMATFLLRASLEKAFQLDEPPPGLSLNLTKPLQGQAPFITSAVDDVMYIVAQVLQRALGTSQRAVVASVIPTAGRVLGSDFVPMIQRKMRDESYPKAVIQGALPPEDKVISFLVLINNLDIATEYIKRIISTHLESPGPNGGVQPSPLAASFPFDNDATFAVEQIKIMESNFSLKCTGLLNDGLSVVFRQVIGPRIRPMLADAFRDIDYNILSSSDHKNLAEDPDSADDVSDPQSPKVPTRFAHSFNSLLRPIKRILTPSTFASLLSLSLPQLAAALERRLWTLTGRVSDLGAIALERDVAGIVAAATRDGRYELRDAFAKCIQIVMIAGMDGDEWEELKASNDGDGDVEWVLQREDWVRARGLLGR